jgi:glycosyltransferase involved in cell wall biosynthesis
VKTQRVERLRVLVVTSLFPSNVDPGLAPFNRAQFSALADLADIDVLGVVPWRVGRLREARWSKHLAREETVDSIPVAHPRYPSIPGMPSLNAGLMAVSLRRRVAGLVRSRGYDVLLASYAYPDGCAGVMLGRSLEIPVVVKCHGSDLNRVPVHRACRLQLQHLLKRAAAVVVVSRQLGERAREMGVAEEHLHVVYNGVDRDRFRPIDSTLARRRLSLPADREIVLYVGQLGEHKGVRDLLDAMPRLWQMRPRAAVVFIGDGPLASEVQVVARERPGGVLAFGAVPHEDIPSWMGAADILCLPSWDEGMPNVVREAHACGRPVVATAVGGVPEAISIPELGVLVPVRNPAALADALAKQLESGPVPAHVIAGLATIPSWRESAQALHAVLDRASREDRHD